ncbi:triose-phosphate isomerase [Fimbriimonas ginsengisoli]|uniref:Triosephosphate isomerase n=1 Tax=Fimbriimonas ginsengisoli Gsoil 348 TaxID=661478 RepID=A0A068NUY2_FIMGI|nr:triose-phosphate isomerase [Fimbriimonas ginsengisoli]AIE87261.1 triosephosphate isomerase [Fimbriimonas ginsengisoli Gsoil 348]
MRKKLVVGNWKMNMTRPEAAACVEGLVRLVGREDVAVAICPPYLALDCVQYLLRNTSIALGAQDVFWKESGAFTGQVSANMLADVGCSYCIVGHSETRGRFGKLEVAESTLGYFSETDETVNLKIKALLYCSISPILCVGETLAEREAGQTDEVIASQLKGALDGIDGSEFREGVVAYEPVWAIGTGKTCDTAEAERVCGMIRSELSKIFDEDTANSIRIQYGGSVKASNAKELFSQPNIDGGLVGGASLNPNEFADIVKAAA